MKMDYFRVINLFVLIITFSYYTIIVSCLKKKEEIKNGDIKIITSDLNEIVTLSCEDEKSIHIFDASYGNPTLDKLFIKKNSFDAPHTLPVIQMICEGKKNCDIKVNNETFKILSLITDFHKLLIKYTCVSSNLEPFPSYKVKAKRGNDYTWNVEFQGETLNKETYLHVNNINATCEEPLVKKTYVDINEAEYECNNMKNCVYVIFNNDGYTLCASLSYKNATIQNNSKIYIKMFYINGNIPSNFEVFPNIQGVCEKDEIIYEMETVLNLDDIYKKCKEVDCDYFTMSTSNGIKGASKSFRNYAWFCKGFPKYVSHEGFLFGKNYKNSKDPKKRITFMDYEGPLR
ncbi:hypothetical protein PGSY75_1327100 [Plasmodium gaboni]|uniref:SUEL-type lectin domain-containing protein n=1 Tax=Plasmodium gaboni TaxID=647221 RepID=A0A151LDV0_9APIC|nr:hypothetical protein PGSY75_1327100 [Plasmodium gaboni]KYN97067.1 hypothetical protein PGSY75_1327100 [Plasmodium gaboni]SOV24325.1 conserved Plasmodium protein, unknown function [Plasmodium sp. DRC-Itaito]